MSGARDHGCDPEAIFDLSEGTLGADREREVRAHLSVCPGCRELYAREMSLNASLGSLEFSGFRPRSVCEGVAMALPTRPMKARVLWAVLAVGLLLAALLALGVGGAQPLAAVAGILGAFWGLVAGAAGLVQALLATAGWMLLAALLVGALADLVIAAAVLTATRRRTREA